MGTNGPDAIHLYIADRSIAELGRRRWILFSQLSAVGTGDTNWTNALWVIGNYSGLPASATALGITWPSRGYVPWSPLVADPTDQWSFSLPGSNLKDAVVTMTNDQGQALSTLSGGQLPSGYGENTISWRITAPADSWSRAPADTRFNVHVENVWIDGQTRSLDYSVTFFVP